MYVVDVRRLVNFGVDLIDGELVVRPHGLVRDIHLLPPAEFVVYVANQIVEQF